MTSISINKRKRKYCDEHRNFKEEWEEDYVFIPKNDKALCLICNTTINNFKIGNLKRYYEKLHPDFSKQFPEKSELRTKKIISLKSSITNQSKFLTKFIEDNKNVVEFSYQMSWNIAREKRPYTDGNFIKKKFIGRS